MLDQLRAAARSPIVMAILAIMALGLAFTGWQGTTGPGANDVAKVGGLKVPAWRAYLDFTSWQDQMRRQDPAFSPFTLSSAERAQLLDQLYARLVQRARIQAEAQRVGIGVSPTTAGQEITSYNRFLGPNGRFVRAEYNEFLAGLGLSEDQFETIIAEELAQSILVDTAQAGLVPPALLATQQARALSEMRLVSFVVIPEPVAFDPGAPTEAEIETVYAANKAGLAAPERRTVKAVVFVPDVEAAKPKVNEEDIAALFDVRMAAASTPETRTIVELISTEAATATLIANRLSDGVPPQTIADTTPGVVLETHTNAPQAELPDPAMAAAAFALAQGEVSAPVETALSWSVVRVDAIVPGIAANAEAIRDEAIDELAQRIATVDQAEAVARFEAELDTTGRLDTAASLAGAAVTTLNDIDAQGLAPSGDRPQAFTEAFPDFDDSAYATLVGAAFAQRRGLPGPTTTFGDAIGVVQVDAVTERQEQTLDAVREEVIAIWRDTAMANAHDTQANAALTTLQAGGSTRQAALAAGPAASADSAVVMRSAASGRGQRGIPPQLGQGGVQRVFGMQPGNAAIIVGAEGALVAMRVEALLPSPPIAPSAPGIDQLREQLDATLRNDVFTAYSIGLSERFEDRRNQATLERVTIAVDG